MTFSQNLVEDLAGLYSSIITQDSEILNEESEFYNEDFAYIFEDVCATICISRLSEGYSAAAVLDYLEHSSEDDLIEYYFNSDINNLSEEVVSEEYFSEQLELLGEALPAVLAGAKLAGKVLAGAGARKAIGSGLAAAGRGLSVAAKRAAGPGVRKAIGGAVGKLKGLAGGARAALSKLPKPVKTLGKLAAGGAAFEAGASAVRKMTGGGSKPAPKPSALGPQKALGGQAAFKAGGGQAAVAKGKSATDVQRAGSEALFKAGGGAAAMAQKGQTRAQVMAQGSKNVAPKPTATPKPAPAPSAPSGGSGGGGASAPRGTGGPSAAPKPATKPAATAAPKPADGAERRTPTSAELVAAQQARKAAQEAGKSKAEAEKAAVQAGIDRGTKLMGGSEGPGQIDTKSVEKDLEDFKKRTMKKEDYAIVADYFLQTGHADTVSEAYYIVAQLDEETLFETLTEAMTKYERNRQRAAQRAAARNAARDRGQTGAVPGVGYVTPRRERETWTDESGQERHTSGARMPKKKED
jgi:hypothetical protein